MNVFSSARRFTDWRMRRVERVTSRDGQGDAQQEQLQLPKSHQRCQPRNGYTLLSMNVCSSASHRLLLAAWLEIGWRRLCLDGRASFHYFLAEPRLCAKGEFGKAEEGCAVIQNATVHASDYFALLLLPGGRQRSLIADLQAGGRPRRRPVPIGILSTTLMASSICSVAARKFREDRIHVHRLECARFPG